MATPSTPTTTSSSVPRPGRRTAVGLVLLLIGAVLALVGPGGSAAAALTNDGMTSIGSSTTPNLDTYPGDLFPAGCSVTDGQVLVDDEYTALGQTVGSMRDLPYLPAGTLLTLTFDGWVEGCETPISLSAKRAVGPDFDETTDQALLAFEGCGPDGANGIPVCEQDGEGRFTLSLVMPAQLQDCSYQTDAVVGPPLEIVGPDGSFYGRDLRVNNGKADGPTMLINADNEGPSDPEGANCQPPSATVECGPGGAVVTITNPDVFNDIRVTVTADGEVVAADVEVLQDGGTAQVTVPLALGEQPVIQVTDAQRDIYGPTPFTETCAEPQANATVDCAEDGSITIDTSSTGPQTVVFTATINGVDVPLDADGSTTVPLTDEPATVVVSANGEVIFTSDPLSCGDPTATAEVDCAEGTITVTVIPGEDPTDEFVVTADGEAVELDGNTATIEVGSEPVQIVVTADGETILDEEVPGCDTPVASTQLVCESNTILVTVGQPSDHTVEFVVTADGTPLTIVDGVATTSIGSSPVTIVVTADGEPILEGTVQPCDEPLVAACVTGKTAIERFTAEDVYDHLDGQFAVNIDEATGTWTSSVPVDFIMVVENNTVVRSFVLPGNFTSGTFDVDTVTVIVNGQPVAIQGTVTDAAGNPVSAAIGGVTAVTFCDGAEPPTEVLPNVQSRQLPRTGAEESGRMALALGFIVTGLGLVLFGEDRRLGLLANRR